MGEPLTTVERRALDVALSGSAPWLAMLRAQVPSLRVLSRNYTGFGFFTDFACENCIAAEGLPPSDSPKRVPVAWAAHPDVESGGYGAICFNVFLKDGVIACLEAASSTNWPSNEGLVTFEEDGASAGVKS